MNRAKIVTLPGFVIALVAVVSLAACKHTEKPPEVPSVMFNWTMPADGVFSVYAQVANEKLQVPEHMVHGRMVRVRTSLVTKTEALKLLDTALLEQAQITITRRADGTLVGTTQDVLRGPPEFMAAMRTYLPDGKVDPPLPSPAGTAGPQPIIRGRQADPPILGPGQPTPPAPTTWKPKTNDQPFQ
jgi:hypothetical protein